MSTTTSKYSYSALVGTLLTLGVMFVSFGYAWNTSESTAIYGGGGYIFILVGLLAFILMALNGYITNNGATTSTTSGSTTTTTTSSVTYAAIVFSVLTAAVATAGLFLIKEFPFNGTVTSMNSLTILIGIIGPSVLDLILLVIARYA